MHSIRAPTGVKRHNRTLGLVLSMSHPLSSRMKAFLLLTGANLAYVARCTGHEEPAVRIPPDRDFNQTGYRALPQCVSSCVTSVSLLAFESAPILIDRKGDLRQRLPAIRRNMFLHARQCHCNLHSMHPVQLHVASGPTRRRKISSTHMQLPLSFTTTPSPGRALGHVHGCDIVFCISPFLSNAIIAREWLLLG